MIISNHVAADQSQFVSDSKTATSTLWVYFSHEILHFRWPRYCNLCPSYASIYRGILLKVGETIRRQSFVDIMVTEEPVFLFIRMVWPISLMQWNEAVLPMWLASSWVAVFWSSRVFLFFGFAYFGVVSLLRTILTFFNHTRKVCEMASVNIVHTALVSDGDSDLFYYWSHVFRICNYTWSWLMNWKLGKLFDLGSIMNELKQFFHNQVVVCFDYLK